MLKTTFGFMPWDDTHHPELSQTDGVPDGRWLFINGNNTPRVARIDLTRSRRRDPPDPERRRRPRLAVHDAGHEVHRLGHAVQRADRRNTDVPIESYKQNFKGTLSFITADEPGKMDIAFQILMPGYNYDLGHAGKGPSDGWFFFTSYNSEQANTKLEVNASQNDKDYIAAVNYGRPSSASRRARRRRRRPRYFHNYMDEQSRIATIGARRRACKMLDPRRLPGRRVLPADAEVAARRRRRSDGRIHRRRRQARHRDPGALVHEDAEGDRRQSSSTATSRGSRSSSTTRSSPAKCRSPASARCTPNSTERATPTRRCSSRPRS